MLDLCYNFILMSLSSLKNRNICGEPIEDSSIMEPYNEEMRVKLKNHTL